MKLNDENKYNSGNEPGDPGHRHRSHLIGICPGDRITLEDTPDYSEGVRKALNERHKNGRNRTSSFTFTWDAQIFARLYDAEEAGYMTGGVMVVDCGLVMWFYRGLVSGYDR